jgi:hypothetical protein
LNKQTNKQTKNKKTTNFVEDIQELSYHVTIPTYMWFLIIKIFEISDNQKA